MEHREMFSSEDTKLSNKLSNSSEILGLEEENNDLK
jgi:hypothetical protein